MSSVSERLASILDSNTLERLAGERSYSRGAAYYLAKNVRNLAESDGVVAATVCGTYDYNVELGLENGELEYSCDCPVGETGAFCKHCVAVALELEGDKAGQTKATGKARTDVRAWLLRQEKVFLVDKLLLLAKRDPDLRRQLEMDAARDNPSHLNVSVFRKAIDDAVYVPKGFIHYKDAYDYAGGIMNVVYSLEKLLEDGHAPQVVDLTERALDKLVGVYGMVDDSGGNVGSALWAIQELHHNACLRAKPDAKKLAGKLLRWEIEYGGDPFHNAADMYADVLGDQGLAAYRLALRAEWDALPQLGPGSKSDDRYGRRYIISRRMEDLVGESGSVDDLVAVLSRDLSSGSSYLKIAEAYDAAKRPDEAVEWAEKGVKAFPDRPNSDLVDFLAEKYHGMGRHTDAVDLIWARFKRFPFLENYRTLRSHADRAGNWSHWREKALAIVPRRRGVPTASRNDFIIGLGNTTLVQIFLWEEDVESAWRAASEGGCSIQLWLELAKLREEKNPDDAIQVYKGAVEVLVGNKDNQSYDSAAKLLQKINGILVRLYRADEFRPYLDSVRAAHKPKRNFMKLLDQTKWEGN